MGPCVPDILVSRTALAEPRNKMNLKNTRFIYQYLYYIAEYTFIDIWILHLRPQSFGHLFQQYVPRMSISVSLLVYKHGTNKLSDVEHLVLAYMLIN